MMYAWYRGQEPMQSAGAAKDAAPYCLWNGELFRVEVAQAVCMRGPNRWR